MATAPNVDNYLIGKGILHFTPEGGARRHLGNVSVMEVELTVEELDHFSSQEGVRSKDLSVITSKTAQIRLTMEEWSAENVALALIGATSANSDGQVVVDVFSEGKIRGRLEFTATNDVGPRWDYDFPSVAFRPNAAISPISEEWGTMEMLGEIELVAGSFGTATLDDTLTDTVS